MSKQLLIFLAEKVENMFKIGKYTNVNGSDGKLQKIQVETLRNIEDALKVGQFGFNSKAPLESRCVVARIGNENIVIANEHQASIIDVNSGDSIIYNENGDYVKVEKDKITISAKEVIYNLEKISISNGSDEIIALLIEQIDEIVVMQGVGNLGNPVPVAPATIAKFEALKLRVQAFQV